ncbi:hypothetical protein HAX54_031250 [Datura stramonium]|uniref:Uncharacterized protein n=1 Tax=Datura stramonium TaxID=4076 RepID=A0ABS8VB00_DATST|nr:hypothetical protein [Datura stramonium]
MYHRYNDFTSKKKQQEASAQKEIEKRRQLCDESESDSSSGSEVHYNITRSDESPVVTTRSNSKSQEAAATTTSPPQFDEGRDEAEYDGDNTPANNVEKGNDDAEESGDDDPNVEESGDKVSAAKESNEQVEDPEPATTLEARSKRLFLQGSRDVYFAGLNLNEKGNPSRSIQEEPKIQINSLNEVPKLKRLFKGYNITTEYDYRMEAMKGIRKLRIEDKVLYFQWMANIISKKRREQNGSQAENRSTKLH